MPGRVAAKQAAQGQAAWGTQWMVVRNYEREVLNPAHQNHPGGFKKPLFPAICQANWVRTSGGGAQTSGIFLAPQGLQCSAEVENHHPSLPWGGVLNTAMMISAVRKEKEGTSHMLSASCASDTVLGTSLILKLHKMLWGIIIFISSEESAAHRTQWLAQNHLNPRKWWGWEIKQVFLTPKPVVFQFPALGEWTQQCHAQVGIWPWPPCPELIWTVLMLFLVPRGKSIRWNKSWDTGS